MRRQDGLEAVDRVRKLYRKACGGENAEACRRLGILYGRDIGVSKDLAKTRALHQEACNLGEGDVAISCISAAVFLVEGRSGSKNLERAETVLKPTCENGSTVACAHLGRLYHPRPHVTYPAPSASP